jgi:ADP-ribose pyrophosphatase YjhB (NUDIX family)
MSGSDAPGGPSPSGPRIGGLRAHYVRRVTAEHVGQRVSIRHLVDDPDRGALPSDVVGRLVGGDDDTLLVVDRAGQLHVVDSRRVLASRTVPAHPRLEPEPEVGTPTAPLPRDAARVLLLDDRDQVLLVAHAPDATRRVWTAPGGGLQPGESHEHAAARELTEEIGIEVALGPWIWSRRVTFAFRGCWIDQSERWYLARTRGADAEAAPLDDLGALSARWWTTAELEDTEAELAPSALPRHLAALLSDGPPDPPIDVGR